MKGKLTGWRNVKAPRPKTRRRAKYQHSPTFSSGQTLRITAPEVKGYTNKKGRRPNLDRSGRKVERDLRGKTLGVTGASKKSTVKYREDRAAQKKKELHEGSQAERYSRSLRTPGSYLEDAYKARKGSSKPA